MSVPAGTPISGAGGGAVAGISASNLLDNCSAVLANTEIMMGFSVLLKISLTVAPSSIVSLADFNNVFTPDTAIGRRYALFHGIYHQGLVRAGHVLGTQKSQNLVQIETALSILETQSHFHLVQRRPYTFQRGDP